MAIFRLTGVGKACVLEFCLVFLQDTIKISNYLSLMWLAGTFETGYASVSRELTPALTAPGSPDPRYIKPYGCEK